MENSKFSFPDPVLDQREIEKLESLTKDYEEFISPGMITKALELVQKCVSEITPSKAKKIVGGAVDAATEWEIIKKTLKYAGQGFMIIQNHASRLTLDKDSVVKTLREINSSISDFEYICTLRSYDIEHSIGKRNYKDLLAAFTEGAVCGMPGLIGVPFNIALSFLLYFRAAQSTALYYGYDVKDDPKELEFAASVTLSSLSPNTEQGIESLTGIIGKMMLAANFTALKSALKNKSYSEMAKKGGAELLYVQIRALANKAVEKALSNAGREGIEAGVFRNLLEQVGKMLPKETGKKAIPVIGALIGGCTDTYYMNRVLKGSTLIYHKRFLFEKEHRVNLLRDQQDLY